MSIVHVLSLFLMHAAHVANALASPTKSYLVTGANKGQGLALCERILTEHSDTHVFLCSRDEGRGEAAKQSLLQLLADKNAAERIDVVPLDVTSDSSVQTALSAVRSTLSARSRDKHPLQLCGIVSNAGILWGHPLEDLIEVCATGVKRVLDAFVPLVNDQCNDSGGEEGRVVVVTSGLGPLMHQYSGEERQSALMSSDCTWESTILPMIHICLDAYASTKESTLEKRIKAFNAIQFPGGPFADSAPDFHMYGLSKMFGDAYMRVVARKYPKLRVTSVDPGLVYTDLILRMPKYEGKGKGETGAQSPHEGVEATMRLLFDKDAGKGEGSGKLYALSKDRTKLVFSDINKMPQKQP
ncbi:hypothetical protein HJC23_008707 [Cyclotella cryptica]|uniref:Protochlorophyllide reductase n=1 Tax=Cyclotella cryptica TaxID=29204 RepID=A0ABD3PD07_9STRA|eukprot:CCRYP_005438-RA/>CCRYP_005438-RA protein AED:0.03 eAED:0.03 QI:125/1/1/1/1/1/2/68/354